VSFNPALLNIRTVDNMRDGNIYDLDYVLAAREPYRVDSVDLADTNGEPAAIPTKSGLRDLDYRYSYIDGSEDQALRLKTYSPSFNIDWIDGAAHTKLQRWMHNRAQVKLAPNMETNTILNFSPVHLNSIAFRESGYNASDKTGQSIIIGRGYDKTLFWDHFANVFRGAMTVNNNCVVPTPAGAGMFASRAHQNRMIPSYPEGAGLGPGAGNSGWSTGGSDASDISFSLVTNGFGHTLCPHSLRVETTDLVSGSRYMHMFSAWDSGHGSYQGWSPSGTGYLAVSFLIRGRLPGGATLTLKKSDATPADDETFTFSGENFSEWRQINLSIYSADWSTGFPMIVLDLPSTNKEPADFELGPYFLYQSSGTYMSGGVWRDHSDGLSFHSSVYVPSFTPPKAGCYTASIYAPPGMVNRHQRVAFMGSGSHLCGSLNMYCDSADDLWVLRFSARNALGAYHYYTHQFSRHFDDEVIAASFQYGTGRRALYLDGELVKEWGTTDDGVLMDDGAHEFEFGYEGGGHDCLPCYFLTGRVDAEVFSDEKIKYLHSALKDPGALAVSVPARGRIFRVTEIPNIPRPSPRGTQWVGKLSLRQVGYDHDNADITAKETVRW